MASSLAWLLNLKVQPKHELNCCDALLLAVGLFVLQGELDAVTAHKLHVQQMRELCANLAFGLFVLQGELDAVTAQKLHVQQMRELCAKNSSLEMQAAQAKVGVGLGVGVL
jgi:anti-anti-sigma regulatory factor